jgi:hypothetical protein
MTFRELYDVYSAYKAGKPVQYRPGDGCEWADASSLLGRPCSLSLVADYQFRIKPEPKLRDWAIEEVPVGAVVNFDNHRCLILGVTSDCRVSMMDADGELIRSYNVNILRGKNYTLDGKTWQPCGVLE